MLYKYLNYPLYSNITIPELSPVLYDLSPKITFVLENEPVASFADCSWFYQWKSETGAVTIAVARMSDHYILLFPGLARFSFFPKKSLITCTRLFNVPFVTIRHLLLDQALPRYFYHFLDKFILHASMVAIRDTGVAFLGQTGWGKSTLAASFAGTECEIITDDCIFLEKNADHEVFGVPSYPGLRLYGDSLQILQSPNPCQHDQMSHYSDKHRIHLPQNFTDKVRLNSLFFLNDPQKQSPHHDVHIEKMDNLEVIPEIIRHGFSLDIEDKKRQKKQLEQMADILDCEVRFFRLSYPREYRKLKSVHTAVHSIL